MSAIGFERTDGICLNELVLRQLCGSQFEHICSKSNRESQTEMTTIKSNDDDDDDDDDHDVDDEKARKSDVETK